MRFCSVGLALAVLAGLAARPLHAIARFAEPAVSPSPQVAGAPLVAHLKINECRPSEFAVVRNGDVFELRWKDPGCLGAPFVARDVPLGSLAAGTYQLQIIDVPRYGSLGVEDVETLTVAGEDCPADTLCLLGGRFHVTARWQDSAGNSGASHPVLLTPETGSLWFFQPTNHEVMLKVHDGCAVNDHFWVYAGGLTDLGVQLDVVDTKSHVEKTYDNDVGSAFAPIADSATFACSLPAERGEAR